ncbi:MAG TPA: MmcQ/YjbR family DNA-binding protein [Candidatus Methylomirabilis sp.]|nr:MmcQ/YjbR family DNA-binding protein [Candidatus Methylomirabilis sp.]
MNIDWVRELCLSLPGTTEEEVWENDLTFKVAGKMFAHTVLVPGPVWLSFKASEESFADLIERQGVIPAPYLARAKWVALETKDALPADELGQLLRASYDMVVAKLPKAIRERLASGKLLVTGGVRPRKQSSKARLHRKPVRKKKRPSH